LLECNYTRLSNSVHDTLHTLDPKVFLGRFVSLQHWALAKGVFAKCQEMVFVLATKHKLGALLFEKCGARIRTDLTEEFLLLHQACLEIAIGANSTGEIFNCWRFGLGIAVHHGADTEFLVVRVAHLG